MKLIKPILVVLTLFALVSASCKKSDSAAPSNAIGISLKINGTAKSSTMVIADYIKSESSLQVIGTFGTEAVSLMVPSKVGTFDIIKDNLLLSYSVKNDYDDTYLGESGTVTITSFTSTTVTGTFQFSGPNPEGGNGAVTEGKFSSTIFAQ